MSRFIFIMQHQPTAEQLNAAAEGGREVVQLADKKLLLVPDDTTLGRNWFVERAVKVLEAVGGVNDGDILHVMGQQQLAMAINVVGRLNRDNVKLVESVTPRTSKEVHQSDGTVKKENVFSFAGFRELHTY